MAFLVVSLPVVFAEELNLVYDANGNLVSGDGSFRIYNSLNQLWKIHNGTSEAGQLLEEYIYHPTEERVWVKKVYNSSAEIAETTIYISDTFVRVVNSSGTYDFAYIKHEGQLVAQVQANGNTDFIHGDNKGSSSVVTDSLGNSIENTSYEPFGGIVSGGSKTRFDYEGKEFDSVV